MRLLLKPKPLTDQAIVTLESSGGEIDILVTIDGDVNRIAFLTTDDHGKIYLELVAGLPTEAYATDGDANFLKAVK